MKKFFLMLSILIIVIALLFIFNTGNRETPAESRLIEVFDSTGAHALSREIYFWARSERGLKSISKMEEMITGLSEELGINEPKNGYITNRMETDSMVEMQSNGRTAREEMINISGRILKTEDETHLIVDVTGKVDPENSGQVEKLVAGICRRYGMSPETNYCITGYFEGKLDTKGLNSICANVFKAAGARKVAGIKDDNLISLTAYSPRISDYITVNGKRVNLNIAIRYNSYEERTYIWLATPLIDVEY